MVAVQIIAHGHVERCGGRSFFLETAHMQVVMIVPAVRQPVNEQRIAVMGKDDGPAGGEEIIEVDVGQAMRMFGLWLQPHEINHIDYPNPQVRKMGAQDGSGSKGLQRRYVATTGHHHIR